MRISILTTAFFAACTILQTNNLEQTWNIIEKASSKHWTKSKLENEIGKATKEIKNPAKKIHLALLYEQSNRQKWGITLSKNNIVESVTYLSLIHI